MTTYQTLQEAQQHHGAVHIHRLADDQWVAYNSIEEIPQSVKDSWGQE